MSHQTDAQVQWPKKPVQDVMNIFMQIPLKEPDIARIIYTMHSISVSMPV